MRMQRDTLGEVCNDMWSCSQLMHEPCKVAAPLRHPRTAGAAPAPEHVHVTCAPADDLPLEVSRTRTTVNGKPRYEEKFLLLPSTAGMLLESQGLGASRTSQDIAQLASAGDELLSQSTTAGMDDTSRPASNADSDSESESSAESEATDVGQAGPVHGAAIVSPGDCRDCGQKCTKNWFECAFMPGMLALCT